MTNNKEVVEYTKQITFVQEQATELVITSDEDMSQGSDLLDDLKKVETALTDRKKEITKPLMASLASARSLFKPAEVAYAEAKKMIKSKMLDYTIAEDERIMKEQSRVEARLEKGTIRVDTAIRKTEEIGEVKKSFTGTRAKTSIRKITKIRIVDESLIPREYLIPDMRAITDAVLREKKEVNGVETFEEKSIVGRSS